MAVRGYVMGGVLVMSEAVRLGRAGVVNSQRCGGVERQRLLW